MKNIFEGRELLIVTKHQKEQVLAPILEQALGVCCSVSEGFDTDIFGTFSGEIHRNDSPINVARKKCLEAMALTNADLAIASEGSFGPHPSIYFIPADEEYLLLIDKKYGLEIAIKELSLETNFSASEVSSEEELMEFAAMVKFPSHGLILRKSKSDYSNVTKGIIDEATLRKKFQELFVHFSSVFVETDMRAMYNPTRMNVIREAVHKLISKMNVHCPSCEMPGFGVTESLSGLPCERCGFPTRGILSVIHTCQKCRFTQEVKYPNNVFSEKAMYCDSCNP